MSSHGRSRFVGSALFFAFLHCAIAASGSGLQVTGSVHWDGSSSSPPPALAELLAVTANYETQRRLLDGERQAPIATAPVDEAGRFQLTAPAPGIYKVRLSARGRVPVQYAPLPVVRATELPPVSLLHNAGSRFEVRDAAGLPLPRVAIYATSHAQQQRDADATRIEDGWRADSRFGRTEADGGLELPRAQDELLDVHIYRATASAPWTVRGVENIRVLLPSPAPVARQVVVQDSQRRPVEGVIVASGPVAWPLGRTSAAGRLRLPGLVDRPISLHLFCRDGRRAHVTLDPGNETTELELPDTVAVLGRTTDRSTGNPVEGALVWGPHEPGGYVLTGPRGAYGMEMPPDDKLWLQAEAAGYAPHAIALRPSQPGALERPVTLELTAAAAVAGKALDTAGRPLAGVEVTAHGSSPFSGTRAFSLDPASGRAWTDAGGGFRISGLDSRPSYLLKSRLTGFLPAAVEIGGLAPGRARTDLELRLAPRRGGFGHITDLQERPLAGVEVRVRPTGPDLPPSTGGEPYSATTDENGRFEIATLPSDHLDLMARREGFAPALVPGLRLPQDDRMVDLGTLSLAPAVRITGEVTDELETPLDDVEVWVSEEPIRSVRATLDRIAATKDRAADTISKQGEFVVENRSRGEQLDLLFTREGFLPAIVRGVVAPPEQPLRVALQRAVRVTGQVRDDQAGPVSGARVQLYPREEEQGTLAPRAFAGDDVHTATTDEEGRFAITGVRPGGYQAEAAAEKLEPSAVQIVEVGGGRDVEGVDFVLRPGATLHGRLSTADGEPVTGANVLVERSAGRSEEDGAYRVEGVPPGPRLIEVRHPHHRRMVREVVIEEGENALDLVLEPGHRVAGRVIDSDGRPLPDVRITLASQEILDPRYYRTMSGQGGEFELPAVDDGRYLLRATHAEYLPLEAPDAVRVAGQPLDGLEVVLWPGATVTGFVLGLELRELTALQVVAVGREGQVIEGRADYEGRYEIAGLPAGAYTLRAVVGDGRRQAEARVHVAAGNDRVERDLEFEPGPALTGRVLHNREPVAGARIVLTGQNVASERETRTDYLGEFGVPDLRPGSYRLSVSHSREMLIASRDLVMESDLDVTIDLQTTEVTGRVLSAASGEPVADALVVLQQLLVTDSDQGGGVSTVGTGAEGSFRFGRIAEGRYRLVVSKGGYAVSRRELQITAAGEDDLEVSLEPTGGLALAVRDRFGGAPPHVTLVLLDQQSNSVLSESREPDAQGIFHFPTVPPGQWRLLVGAPGAASRVILAQVQDDPNVLEVVLPQAAVLSIEVPALYESLRVGTLSIFGSDGSRFIGLDPQTGQPRIRWPLVGGVAGVADLAPGGWQVELVTPDGERRVFEVTLIAGINRHSTH